MGRIPLQVYFFAGSSRIMAHFLLKSSELSFSLPIKAIVDTGSPVTLIGNSDLKRMRLSSLQIRKLVGEHKEVNMGGGKVVTKVLENANLKFGNEFNVEMSVQFPIDSNNKNNQPSLLGVDFMLKTKSKLVFNPNKSEAYFEIDD